VGGPFQQLGAWSPETLEGPSPHRVDAQEEPRAPINAKFDDRPTRKSLIAERDYR